MVVNDISSTDEPTSASAPGAHASVPAISDDQDKGAASMRRRRRLLAGVVVAAVLAAAAGAGAAAVLKSPAQLAAETAAPPSDTLTAQVERRVVADSLITRGKVASSSTADVASAPPTGVEGARAVVTKVNVTAGASLELGKVLFEVSGRPVFTLGGPLPAYRDLKTGTTGDDVAQLQRALAKLGRSTAPDTQGVFGAGTERAVIAFYKSIGYRPVRTPAPSGAVEDKAGSADTPSGSTGATASPKPKAPAASGVVTVPMSEVVYLSALPARAEAVGAKVGAAPGEKLMTVSTGDLVVQGSVSPRERDLLRAGLKVEIFHEATGIKASGLVQSVAETPTAPKGEQGTPEAPGFEVRVKPDQPLPPELAGKDVRLTVTAASSDVPVLAVPSAALSAGADGRTTVSVQQPDGAIRRVDVRPGRSGGGFVEVTPEAGQALGPGDKVVVGSRPAGATAVGRP